MSYHSEELDWLPEEYDQIPVEDEFRTDLDDSLVDVYDYMMD